MFLKRSSETGGLFVWSGYEGWAVAAPCGDSSADKGKG